MSCMASSITFLQRCVWMGRKKFISTKMKKEHQRWNIKNFFKQCWKWFSNVEKFSKSISIEEWKEVFFFCSFPPDCFTLFFYDKVITYVHHILLYPEYNIRTDWMGILYRYIYTWTVKCIHIKWTYISSL